MQIKELFEEATKSDFLDLQALIMFLVFEQGALSMEDDAKKLDLYFLDKHNQRMNKELIRYKLKMGMKYGLQVYEIMGENNTTYIAAYSEKQAKYIASKNIISISHMRICSSDEVMTYNDREMKIKNLIKPKEVGILGGF